MGKSIFKKARKSEIIKFSFGGVGVNILVGTMSAYIMYFFTDVAGVSAVAAGSIYLISKIFDAVIDPVMGLAADNTNTKFGKYRPYLIFGAPLAGLVFVLLFSVPDLSASGKSLYYGVLFVLYSLMFTVMVVPYYALTPLMTRDPDQRSFVVAAKNMMAGITMPIVMGLTLVLADDVFGGGPEGWQKLITIYAVVMVITMWLCSSGAKNYDLPNKIKSETSKIKIKDQLMSIKANKPLFILTMSYSCMVFANAVLGAAALYFYKYIMNYPKLVVITSMIGGMVTIVAIALSPFLMNKFGKKRVFNVMAALTLIQPIVLLIFRPFASVPIIAALWSLNMSFIIMTNIVAKAMLPDCVDYGEWKTGVKNPALTSTAFSFAAKIFVALGGAIVGIIIGIAGYIPGQAQTPIVINTIVYLITLLPIVSALLSIILMKLYPISIESYTQMVTEIEQRGNESEII